MEQAEQTSKIDSAMGDSFIVQTHTHDGAIGDAGEYHAVSMTMGGDEPFQARICHEGGDLALYTDARGAGRVRVEHEGYDPGPGPYNVDESAWHYACLQSGLDTTASPGGLQGDDALTAYIESAKVRDSLEDRLKEIKSAMDELEERVTEFFVEEGTQKTTRRGRTVYLAKETWPKMVEGADKDAVLEALKSSPETAHLVGESYNSQSLRGLLNSDFTNDDGDWEIPEWLKSVIEPSVKIRAKVRKTG